MHLPFRALVIGLSFFFLLAPDAAQAQASRIYFAGYFGLSTGNENDYSESQTNTSGEYDTKHTQPLAGALGLRLTPEWRVEAEVSYRKVDFDQIENNGTKYEMGGDVTAWIYMLNLYYDFDPIWKKFQPFLTAGLGVAVTETDVQNTNASGLPSYTDDDMDLAWQIGSGVKYRLSPDLAVTGNYRYLATADIGAQSFDLDYNTHELRLGLEYDIPVRVFEDIVR